MGAYGWRALDVTKHTIREVITVVLADEREWEPGRHVPLAVDEDDDCLVCILFLKSTYAHLIKMDDDLGIGVL